MKQHYYRHLASGTSCWTLPAPVTPPPISMTPPDSPRSPTRRQPSATPPSQVGLGLVLQQIEGDPSGGGRVRVDRLIAGGGAALSGQVSLPHFLSHLRLARLSVPHAPW